MPMQPAPTCNHWRQRRSKARAPAAEARERAERACPQGRDAAGTSESLGPTEVLPTVGPFQVGDTASGVRQMSYDRARRAAGTGLRFTARSRSGLGTRVPRDASSLGPHLPCSEIQLAPLQKSPRARIRKGELFNTIIWRDRSRDRIVRYRISPPKRPQTTRSKSKPTTKRKQGLQATRSARRVARGEGDRRVKLDPTRTTHTTHVSRGPVPRTELGGRSAQHPAGPGPSRRPRTRPSTGWTARRPRRTRGAPPDPCTGTPRSASPPGAPRGPSGVT